MFTPFYAPRPYPSLTIPIDNWKTAIVSVKCSSICPSRGNEGILSVHLRNCLGGIGCLSPFLFAAQTKTRKNPQSLLLMCSLSPYFYCWTPSALCSYRNRSKHRSNGLGESFPDFFVNGPEEVCCDVGRSWTVLKVRLMER